MYFAFVLSWLPVLPVIHYRLGRPPEIGDMDGLHWIYISTMVHSESILPVELDIPSLILETVYYTAVSP